jgi:Xaa-Pro dipeptidase
MSNIFKNRTVEFQSRMADTGIDVMLLADPDSIYYFTAYWGDLGVEFGRPSLLAIPRDAEPTLITSSIEGEMCDAMTWIDDTRFFSDGVGAEWVDPLQAVLEKYKGHKFAAVREKLPSLVLNYFHDIGLFSGLLDGKDILSQQRMIKTGEEIKHLRQAGQVATAMTDAARAVIAEGVSEYEVAIAIQSGGTRKAAEIIEAEDIGSLMSPVIHNLQSINSGAHTAMAHLHPTVRRLKKGDPIYLCFCAICHFKQLKIGYDRQYFVNEVSDEHARIYEIAVEAQQAAISEMRPGVTAEHVHLASAEVYKQNDLGLCYRTGRAVGYSSLELPELKEGDKTVLAPGMSFAVDGGITIPGEFGARIGDTILVTEDGCECVTEYPRHEIVI